ncbi:MAG TPA: zf-HC2 domain-containing protein [Acidobacteriaceae bacterium]|jgi:hypothetical protein
MTQTFQPGKHPDADQLSAFAEHALPPHEQQQLLAHLADCADCRALIFLAHEAMPVVAAQAQPAPAYKPWFAMFSGWKLAIPAAAALACLLAVMLHLHNRAMDDRMTAIVNQTARVEPAPPPAPPPPPEQPMAAAEPAPLKAAVAQPPGPLASASPPALSLDKKSEVSIYNGNVGSVQAGAVHGYAVGRSSTATDGNEELKAGAANRQTSLGMVSGANLVAPKPATAAGPSSAAAQNDALSDTVDQATVVTGASVPPRAAPPNVLHSLNQQYNAQPLAPPLPPPPPQAAQAAAAAPAPQMTNETVSVTSAEPALETESSTSAGLISGASFGPLQASKARLARKQAELPSRRPVVSTISNAQQQLALDTAGQLFRSEDAGVTWRRVTAQWSGRAVKVALAASATVRAKAKDAAPSAVAVPAKDASAAPTQPALFELTTDAGATYTSPDGLHWTHK